MSRKTGLYLTYIQLYFAYTPLIFRLYWIIFLLYSIIFRLYSTYISLIFHLYLTYIRFSHSNSENFFPYISLIPAYIPLILSFCQGFLSLYFAYIIILSSENPVIFRLYYHLSRISELIFRLYYHFVKKKEFIFRLYPIIFRLYTAYIPLIFRLYDQNCQGKSAIFNTLVGMC